MSKAKAIVMKPYDNVATVVDAVEAGTDVTLTIEGERRVIAVTETIPFGHKFALCDIPAGEAIKKYGEIIGIATKRISAGQYVHVHNLESRRGRGDK